MGYDLEKCNHCGRCIKVCPYHARTFGPDKTMVIDEKECRKCGLCVSICGGLSLSLIHISSQVENCGAYNNQAPWMNIRAMVHSAGPYKIDNIRTDTYGVYTNNPTPCAFRGYSSPQVIFGNEMIMDEPVSYTHLDVYKRQDLRPVR